MSQVSQNEDNLAFERLLLNAGRAEAPPLEQTEAALLTLVAGLNALQGAIGSATGCAPASRASTGSWARLVTTGKWVGLGVVAGGLAMFGWLRHETPISRAPQATHAPGVEPRATTITPAVGPEIEQPVQPLKPSQHLPARAAQGPRTPSVSSSLLPGVKSGSDLAAEVAALDGIRTALSMGAWRDAEKQSESYRRTFPQGALRSEAEVLAIEGLVAQGRKQAAIDAGERFISSHPRDPQAARVRALIE